MNRLTDDGRATEIILDMGDLPMLVAMRARAEAAGVDLATFARAALQRYAAEASDEEWITLMGLMGRTNDPGRVCFKRAFDNALRA
ncbi:MAG TPA: hypothetical protein VEJ43_10240 [Pseudolabrys sp.]|nr:hypothetical protein [Pseudolabrys sp.]